MSARSWRTVAFWVSAGAVAACSLFTDLDSLDNPVPSVPDAAQTTPDAGTTDATKTDDGGTSGDTEDAAPLADANLPPPPETCKKDGLACIAAAPSGWAGPFSLYQGGVPSAPMCPEGTTSVLDANGDLVPAAPAGCAACACAAATGFTCGKVTVAGRANSCNCTTGNSNLINANACVSMPYGTLICDGFAADTVNISPAAATGGSCAPVAAKPAVTKTTPAWNVAAVGCQLSVPSQVDCKTGEVCAAVAAPPFNPGLCVMKAGDVAACPGFPYSKRTVFYRGVDDTRDCGGCSCGAAPASTCPTMAKTSTLSDCSDESFLTTPRCFARSDGPHYYVKATVAQPTGVQCPPSGGAPVGGVTTADAVTVCCVP